MATIGSLAVNIVATTDKFIKGLHNAQLKLGGFVNKVSVGAGAVTAAFGGMLRMFEGTGSQLHDLSMATGMSVENLSFLKYAAEQSGAGLDNVTKAARNLQKNGINPNDFNKIAGSIAAITDPTKRAQAAFETFGLKSGAALLPMLQDLPELQSKFEKLGGTFTDKMAKAADDLGDSIGDLKLMFQSVVNVIAIQLAPMVKQATEWITENSIAVRQWIADHGTLVKAIAVVALGLTAIAPVLWTINTAVQTLTGSIALFNLATKSGVLMKMLAVAGPVGVAALAGGVTVGAAYEAYNTNTGNRGGSSGASRSWEEDKNSGAQLDEQKQTNDLLREMAGTRPVQLAVAGVR